MTNYYHGGVPGLRFGEELRPSTPNYIDDCPVCQAKRAGISTVFDPVTAHPDRVYITTDREYARFYASKWPYGSLYRVEPVGALEPADEDRFPSFLVVAARVRQVMAERVKLTPAERHRLMVRWPRGADEPDDEEMVAETERVFGLSRDTLRNEGLIT